MTDLNRIEHAAREYLDADQVSDDWPSVQSNFYNIAAEPHVNLDLVAITRKLDSTPSQEELQALGKLVKDLTGVIKLSCGDTTDAVRDDLLLQARQLLGLIGL
ncbi:MAG TPA: hypothetical protein VFF81_08545 [Noviherbaspirillum sp.]|nr:hypothetical protein [Noviherbaspirillum sp.]